MTMYAEPAQNNPNSQSASSMLSGLNSFYGAAPTPPTSTPQWTTSWGGPGTNQGQPNSGGYDYNNNPGQYTGFTGGGFNPINAPLNMGQAYNQSLQLAGQYKQAGNPWNQQGLQYVFGQMGLPAPIANQMWQDAQTQGFPSEQTWANDLQGAVNQYNQAGQQGQLPGQGPPPWMQQGGGIPPQLQSWLQQQGWTAPTGGGTGQPATTATSPVSTGAPPWAQALAGGYALPAFTNQGSLPLPSAQQWNSFMPQEQQAILGTAQSVGIDPGAYMNQYYASTPEWGGIGPAVYQGG